MRAACSQTVFEAMVLFERAGFTTPTPTPTPTHRGMGRGSSGSHAQPWHARCAQRLPDSPGAQALPRPWSLNAVPEVVKARATAAMAPGVRCVSCPVSACVSCEYSTKCSRVGSPPGSCRACTQAGLYGAYCCPAARTCVCDSLPKVWAHHCDVWS